MSVCVCVCECVCVCVSVCVCVHVTIVPLFTVNGGTPSDLIGWFNSEIEKHAATFIVYYRGLW